MPKIKGFDLSKYEGSIARFPAISNFIAKGKTVIDPSQFRRLYDFVVKKVGGILSLRRQRGLKLANLAQQRGLKLANLSLQRGQGLADLSRQHGILRSGLRGEHGIDKTKILRSYFNAT